MGTDVIGSKIQKFKGSGVQGFKSSTSDFLGNNFFPSVILAVIIYLSLLSIKKIRLLLNSVEGI